MERFVKKFAEMGRRRAGLVALKAGLSAAVLFSFLSFFISFNEWKNLSERHDQWLSFIQSPSGSHCKRLNTSSFTEDDVQFIKSRAENLLKQRESDGGRLFRDLERPSTEGLKKILDTSLQDWSLSASDTDDRGYKVIVLFTMVQDLFSECNEASNPGNFLLFALNQSMASIFVVMLSVAALVTVFYGYSIFWCRQTHVGWKRLALVISGLVTLIFFFLGMNDAPRQKDILLLIGLWLPLSFFSCLAFILLSKGIWVWVVDGFNENHSTLAGEQLAGSRADSQEISVIVPAPVEQRVSEEISFISSGTDLIPINDITVYWRRLWARGIDIFIVYFVFNIFGIFIPDDFSSLPAIIAATLLQVIFLSLLLLAYDTFLISKYGRTPGKALLGLSVLSVDHKALNLRQSFARAKAELIGGLYLFIFFPYLQMYGAWVVRRPSWIGQTNWDMVGRSYVACRKINPVRKWFAYSLSLFLLLAILLASKVAKEITKNQIRDSVIINMVR